jgi:O-antigen/teichoic acid export membrane protein
VLAVGLGKAFDSLNDILCGLAQRCERLDRVAYSRVLAGISSLVGLALLAWLTGSLLWASLGWAAGHGLTLVLAPFWIGDDVIDRRRQPIAGTKRDGAWSHLAPIWNRAILWRLTFLALPLGIVMMLVSLYHNIPRYFVEHQLGEESLGIFAALAYLMVAGHMVVVAVGQAATPRFAKLFAAGELGQFVRLLGWLSALTAGGSAAGVIAAWLWGDTLLAILYTPEYAQHGWLLVVLAVGAAIQLVSSLFGEAMTATRRFRSQVPLLLAVVVSTAMACWWLVPIYGLLGAALATGVGAVCQLVGCVGIVGWAIQQRARGMD